MNIIVIPDGAMLIVPLIEKNGHSYLSPTDFSKYNNEIDLNPDFKINLSSETPSGVRGRISLLAPLLDRTDAAIILGKRPPNYKALYGALNEVIMFGSGGCDNAFSLTVNMVSKLNIPILKLAHPTSQKELIQIIHKVNFFLSNLNNISSQNDDLNCDLNIKKDKFPLSQFKKILNNSI